ncbi:helix-turn-helix domain-containing protein [Amycolatopsis sp. NPDC051903]|uniref:helix-turn-helix domain-containing protein n=1 Tax=Amycolatopsis sp. NPDC051903 TaxID=3363936 RepID=UPI0037B89DEB
MAATCRYFGISRTIFSRWKRRWEDEGVDGLKDRSSAPLHCPTITHPEVVEKIIHLRQRYHFGPLKIEMYLRRYHDVEIAASTIYRILKRLGMNRLPASQRYQRHQKRWKRYEKQRPGHQLQIDVTFVEPITTSTDQRRRKFYQYTAIDDCTRLRIHPADLPTLGPEDRDPVPGLCAVPAAVPGREDPHRQRCASSRPLPQCGSCPTWLRIVGIPSHRRPSGDAGPCWSCSARPGSRTPWCASATACRSG